LKIKKYYIFLNFLEETFVNFKLYEIISEFKKRFKIFLIQIRVDNASATAQAQCLLIIYLLLNFIIYFKYSEYSSILF